MTLLDSYKSRHNRKAQPMSRINFDQLRAGGSADPEAGLHEARLERAKVVDTKNGAEMMVTEWSTADNTQWTAWHGFTSKQLDFTVEYLDELGIGHDFATREQLEDALDTIVGRYFQVRVEISRGFVNTFIEQPIEPDVPIDAAGLPEVTTADADTGW